MKNAKSILPILILSLFIFEENTEAQVLPSTLMVALPESGNPSALVNSGNIRKTSDGGYLMAGTMGNGDFSRAVVVKTNAEFDPEWSYRLNQTLTFGNSYQASYGVDVLELGNDEYALLAAVNMNLFSNNPVLQNLDFGFVRFKRTGNGVELLAANRFGTDFNEVPHGMIRTADGGFMLCGYSNLEQGLNLPTKALTFLVKLNENGTQEWGKRYRNQAANCNTTGLSLFQGMLHRNVVETQDGSYVFFMSCDEFVYLTKVDGDGEEIWSRSFDAATGFADGASNDLGAIGVATGSGGAIVGVREMPNGDLAFLGNHFAYFIALLILDGNGNGAGLFLPFSYIFTTDASGQFKEGIAFFHERYNDPDQPVEMMANSFEVLPNGRFLVGIGVNQSGDGSGNQYYRPGFVEVDISQQGIDQSVVRAARIGDDLPIYYNNDNARGMSWMRMHYDHGAREIALSYNLRNAFKIEEYQGVNDGTACTEPIPNMHSFAFELNLLNYTMSATTIGGAAFVPTMAAIDVTRTVECAEPPVATEEILPTTAEAAAVIAPTVHNGQFEIRLISSAWSGAAVEIADLTGRTVYRGEMNDTILAIQLDEADAGVYLVRLSREGQQQVMKTIMLR